MDKVKYVLLVLSPILIGWMFNYLVLIPLLIYAAPLLLAGYWFWVGMKFQEGIKNPIKSIILAHLGGIISLILYYWQFMITSDEYRNLAIAGLSQYFSAPLSYVTAKIGLIFTHDEITQATSFIMQISGLLLMMIVFLASYIYSGKRHQY